MNLIEWINGRVGLADDSETFRAQKILAVGLAFFGSLFTLITGAMHYVVGFNAAALVFLFMAAVLGLCGATTLWRPRTYAWVVGIALVVTVLANAASQVVTGGLTAGNFVIVWAIVALIFSALLTGWRFTIALFLLFCLSVVAIVLLDPYSRHFALQAERGARLAIGAYSLIFMGAFIVGATLLLFRIVETYRLRADELLLNILPAPIAERLKQNPETIADGYSEVSVLFADIVDFTNMSSGADPVEVVNLLNEVFSEFDVLAQEHGLEKIKTIGDAYMVAAGLPEPRPDHAQAIAAFALDMLDAIEKHAGFHGKPIRLRVGINTGPVVAGVIGRQKFIYDLWGDAVNVASRMESNGLSNQIQVTEAVKLKLGDRYVFDEREPINIKGKGMMVTYLLERRPRI